MAKDSIGTHDSVGVSLERTPKKTPDLALLGEPRCPKCGALSRDLHEGQRGCSSADCGHIFPNVN